MELALIIVAAGSSSRFNAGEKEQRKKEYLPLKTDDFDGGTVLSSAAKIFLKTKKFRIVAITYPFSKYKDELEANERMAKAALFSDRFFDSFDRTGTNFIFVPGGETRQESVRKALEEVAGLMKDSGGEKIVFIHDGARPFLKAETIEATLAAALEYGASVPGLQPTDTQKETAQSGTLKILAISFC